MLTTIIAMLSMAEDITGMATKLTALGQSGGTLTDDKLARIRSRTAGVRDGHVRSSKS